MKNQKDDTFLARWANNELSSEELEDFKKDPDFPLYQKIIMGTDAISPQEFDDESLLHKIKEGKPVVKGRSRQINVWVYGMAAVLALLIGAYVVFTWKTTYSSEFGQTLAFKLPDQSEVILNANSSASYKRRGWEDQREVSLDGEAYFKVEKGSTFEVQTSVGTVSVLGTQFNITSLSGLFEVTCFEGKVAVNVAGKEEAILLPGDVFRQIGDQSPELQTIAEAEPDWLSGRSTFRKMPLRFVLDALANQYGIEVVGEKGGYNQLFSGSFPHDDLEVALRVVLGSLEIEYTIEDQKVILKSDS